MHNPLPIVVLISGNGTNLQAIIDAIDAGLAATISAVISDQPDAYGLTRAEKSGIPCYTLKDDQAIMDCIDRYHPELIVMAGFMKILGKAFVQHYAGHLINIHPSLLPKYPGLNTHQRALDNHDKVHGVTIHFVTEAIDAGPIIEQASVPIDANETAKTLEEKIHTLEHRLYPAAIRQFAEGKIEK